MSHIVEVIRYLHLLEIHPLSAVIAAALLAALIEQRMVRRGTPDFSNVFSKASDGPPLEPPPKDIGHLRSGGKRR